MSLGRVSKIILTISLLCFSNGTLSTASLAKNVEKKSKPSAKAKAPKPLAKAEINNQKLELEVAQTPEEVEFGLMERASLPKDHGMLFIFDPPRMERFWMGHCLMSLDMLFIKDGKIVTISHDAPPYKFGPPNKAPLYPAEGEVMVSDVIELTGGYCKAHGIKDGDTVKIEMPASKY